MRAWVYFGDDDNTYDIELFDQVMERGEVGGGLLIPG